MKTFARTATLTIVLCVSHVLAAAASAQEAGTEKAHPSEKWVVLIGVDQYAYASPLEYAVADQQALHDELLQQGLDERQVKLLHDKADNAKYLPTKRNIEQQIILASELAERGDLVLVVFSGHGRHVSKKSFICPADANLDQPDTMIALEWIYDQLKKSKADLKMVIVDACRDVDPLLSRNKGGSEPDRQEEIKLFVSSSDRLPNGLILLHSCSEGEKAKEDKAFGHGVFSYFLLQGLKGKADADKNGRVTLGELMSFSNRETKLHVRDKFGEIQRPKVSGNYTLDAQDFEVVSLSGAKVPDRVARMNPADSPKRPISPGDNEQEITNSIGMQLKLIPAGEFMMGSPEDEADRSDDEGPQHKVRITKPFYIGIHEVTKGQFARFVADQSYKTEPERDGEGGWGYNESKNKFEGRDPKYTWKNTGFTQTDDHPVVNVTWNDAVAYCEWLSSKEGKKYRLPTEAEWEYACRAGTTTAYQTGNDVEQLATIGNVADGTAKAKFSDWTAINARDGYVFSAPAGRFKPNAFGLYDMHGNVWEWCTDEYDSEAYKKRSSGIEDPIVDTGSGSSRVLRGGSWRRNATRVRSSSRHLGTPVRRDHDNGFRVVAE